LSSVSPCTTLTLPVKMALLSCSRTSSLSLSIWIGLSPSSLMPVLLVCAKAGTAAKRQQGAGQQISSPHVALQICRPA
jgi:hypothetical protein